MSPVRKQLERRKRPPFPSGYTSHEAARLLDLSVGQVYAYVRADFLQPRRGPRGEYRFSFQDLVLLRTAKELSCRLSTRRVKRALGNLKKQLPRGRELTGVRITAVGDDVVVRDGGTTWNPESGQTLLDFEVSELADGVAPLVRKAAKAARSVEEQLQAEDWYELGCELETCEPDEAGDAYRRAVELDPRHVDAHVNLGRLLHEAGELRAAEEHYRTALQIEPEDATAAYDLGVLLQDLGRQAEAVTAYTRAIQADPGYADAHYNLAHLYEQLGRAQGAVKHLQIYRRLSCTSN
ncbi:MAG: tetratricopeptide repeat protein [Candidatus Krumholzibacteriia bacterium]